MPHAHVRRRVRDLDTVTRLEVRHELRANAMYNQARRRDTALAADTHSSDLFFTGRITRASSSTVAVAVTVAIATAALILSLLLLV